MGVIQVTSDGSHPWKYEDPRRDEPGRKGMLLSNEIDKFRQVGLLIAKHYDEKCLRPAAYTLRIGPDYIDSMGNPKKLTEENRYYKMPPNSIVYVSTYEKLDLPCYIAARFNLRVQWVYKGILLGTGPQVEPGYRGYLSCPLYNLTDQPIRIEYKELFATIDFERTTDFCEGVDSQQIEQAIEGREKLEKLDRVEVNGQSYLLFKQQEYPPFKLYPDHDVTSSLVHMSNEVKTWRQVGIGLIISFFALTLTLLSFGNNIYTQLTAQARDWMQAEKSLRNAQTEVGQLQKQVTELERRLATVEDVNARRGPSVPQKAPVKKRP
jgi:deoxycytidine triphosphate deaminase